MSGFHMCTAQRVAHTHSQMGLFFPRGARILSWVKISVSLPGCTWWSLLGLRRLWSQVMEVFGGGVAFPLEDGSLHSPVLL